MFMKNIFIKLAKIAVVFFGILNTGCEDFLDINSSTATDDTIVLSNTSNLDKILVGTYNGLLMGEYCICFRPWFGWSDRYDALLPTSRNRYYFT